MEAALATFVGNGDVVLVCSNGIYGERIALILSRLGRRFVLVQRAPSEPIDPRCIDEAVRAHPACTHLAFVHCETTTGVMNPLSDLVCLAAERRLTTIVDAVTSFGGCKIDLAADPVDALVASTSKCVEAPPGIAFAICRRELLGAADCCGAYCLDLADQWRSFEQTGDWRFTPPTHVVHASLAALRQLDSDGGVAARQAKQKAVQERLLSGLLPLGFEPVVHAEHRSSACLALRAPQLIRSDEEFGEFYGFLYDRGLCIYPRLHAQSMSFRIGCMGMISSETVDRLVEATRRFAEYRSSQGR